MTWTKISDDFYDRPDLDAVGAAGALLYVEALVYANRHLTDGVIKRLSFSRIKAEQAEAVAAALVKVGLWETVPGGWVIDMTDQPTREEVEAQRAARAEAGRRGGLASGAVRRSKAEASASL